MKDTRCLSLKPAPRLALNRYERQKTGVYISPYYGFFGEGVCIYTSFRLSSFIRHKSSCDAGFGEFGTLETASFMSFSECGYP